MVRVIGLAGLVMLTAGCAVQTPESRMGAVDSMARSGWAATPQGQAGVDRDWIGRFGDRGLKLLVNEAMNNNRSLQATAARVNRAAAAAKISGAAIRPISNGTLVGRNSEQKFVGFPFGGGQISESYGTSVDVSWELDLWGRVRAGQAADVAEWQAQGLEYNAAQTSLAAQIAKAWFALGETNEQIVLAQSALKIRQNTEEAIRDRFERALLAEGGTASQLRLAQVDVATAKANLAQWQGERESVLRQIELLAGRYPSGSDLSRKGLPALPGYPPAGLPSELLMRRPDVLAAERRFAATGKRIREAELAVFPSLTLNGSLGTSTDSLKNVLDSSFGVWSYGAAVSQPILTGGQLRAEQKARQAGEREALATLQQTVLTAFGEVEQALVAERYLARRAAASEEAVKLAKEAAESAAEDFADGSEDVLTLLLALTRKIDSASALVTLRRLRLDNRINLHLALGGDFKLR